jgi:hypothetical protein
MRFVEGGRWAARPGGWPVLAVFCGWRSAELIAQLPDVFGKLGRQRR